MTEAFSTDTRTALITLLRERRTTGPLRYDPDRKPDHAVVLDAIESARWAPNHKRTEPWRFYVLGDSQIQGLADVNAERMRRAGASAESISTKHQEWAGTPGLMVLMCQHAAEHDDVLRKENYAACAAAAQNFQLHLFANGIAAKWSTAACWDIPEFWPLLGHENWPQDMEPVGLFFYGIPARLPPARRNLEAQDVTVDLRATAP